MTDPVNTERLTEQGTFFSSKNKDLAELKKTGGLTSIIKLASRDSRGNKLYICGSTGCG